MFHTRQGKFWVSESQISFSRQADGNGWLNLSLYVCQCHWHTCITLKPTNYTNIWVKKAFFGAEIAQSVWRLFTTVRFGDRIPLCARFSAPVQPGPGAHPASYAIDTLYLAGPSWSVLGRTLPYFYLYLRRVSATVRSHPQESSHTQRHIIGCSLTMPKEGSRSTEWFCNSNIGAISS